MEKNHEIQNSEVILPGNLGYLIDPSGNRRPILKVFKAENGSTTITIGTAAVCPLRGYYEIDQEDVTPNSQ